MFGLLTTAQVRCMSRSVLKRQMANGPVGQILRLNPAKEMGGFIHAVLLEIMSGIHVQAGIASVDLKNNLPTKLT